MPPPSEADMQMMRHMLQAVAERLGLSEQELMAEGRAGRSLADVAAGRGLERDALVQAMTAGTAGWLAQEVAAGRLPQSEADVVLQRTQQFAAQMVAFAPPPGRPPPGGGPPPPSPR
jgi:hypothetical protein